MRFTAILLALLLMAAGLAGCAASAVVVPESAPKSPAAVSPALPVESPAAGDTTLPSEDPAPKAPDSAEEPAAETPGPSDKPAAESPASAEGPQPPADPPPEPWPGALPLGNDYIAGAADGILRQIILPEMDQYQQIQTVYRWLVENTAFFEDRPVGLDVWQWRGDIRQVPGYVENRAVSALLFGIGSCEDYASAAVVLLRRLGLPAEYVAGLTISVRGDYVPHAWAVVQLDGRWYHIDPQLEDNVTRRDRLTYRFFLKGDEAMAADHRWGENLIAYYGREMTAERAEKIRKNWSVPACLASLPQPQPEQLHQPPLPDRARVLEEIAAERRAWEQLHGPLPPVEMNITPPEL